MGISEYQYREMLTRTSKVVSVPHSASAVERESDLHEQIKAFCKSRGWICIHSRMDRKATNACGTPDFIVATDDGRTIYAEAKRKGGKLSVAQQATLAWLQHNKQIAGVVMNLDEFKKLAGHEDCRHQWCGTCCLLCGKDVE